MENSVSVVFTSSFDSGGGISSTRFNQTSKPRIERMRHGSKVQSIAMSSDQHLLASCGHDNSIVLWRLEDRTRMHQLEDHTASVSLVCFDREDARIASSSDDRTIKIWQVESGLLLLTIEVALASRVWSLAFSEDNSRVHCACQNGTLRGWDALTAQCLFTVERAVLTLTSLSFSSDAHSAAAGDENGTVTLWDSCTGDTVLSMRPSRQSVWVTAFNPQSTMLATGGEDKMIRVWNIEEARAAVGADGMVAKGTERVFKGHKRGVLSVRFSRDGGLLASGSDDQTVRIWDWVTGSALHILRTPDEAINWILFSQEVNDMAIVLK